MAESSPIKVFYLNNDGGGFSDYVEVPAGTTVGEFFKTKGPGIGGGNPEDYMIRVNRLPAHAGQMLADGERVSITPTKVKGARAAA